MKIEIKHRWTSAVLFSIEAGSVKLALEIAIKGKVNLEGADLKGAYLETGETLKEYLSDVLPSLLVAGGKSLDAVITQEHWSCHSWDNCPMAAAFGVHEAKDAPPLWRHRVEQFVRLFDAGLIPFAAVEHLAKKEDKACL